MTIQEALKAPQDFLYLFAADTFLAKLDKKTAAIIRKKRTNQSWLLNKICVENGADYSTVVGQINQKLIDNFGYSGVNCLKRLASGEEVAGKNWSKGIYGIGALSYEGFTGTDITVNKETGKLLQGGQEIAGQTAIYGKNYTTYTANVGGIVYTSTYNKRSKLYSAGTYTNADGDSFLANGTSATLSDSDSIWSSVESFMPLVEKFVNWLTSLFPALFDGREKVTAANTAPKQTDGFVQNSGVDIKTIGIGAGIMAAVYAAGKYLKKRKK